MNTVLQCFYEKTLPTATRILFGNFSASTRRNRVGTAYVMMLMIYRMQLLTSREPAVICTIQTLRSTRTRLIQTGAGYCLVFAPCL